MSIQRVPMRPIDFSEEGHRTTVPCVNKRRVGSHAVGGDLGFATREKVQRSEDLTGLESSILGT